MTLEEFHANLRSETHCYFTVSENKRDFIITPTKYKILDANNERYYYFDKDEEEALAELTGKRLINSFVVVCKTIISEIFPYPLDFHYQDGFLFVVRHSRLGEYVKGYTRHQKSLMVLDDHFVETRKGFWTKNEHYDDSGKLVGEVEYRKEGRPFALFSKYKLAQLEAARVVIEKNDILNYNIKQKQEFIKISKMKKNK